MQARSEVFDSFWRFTAERHAIYERRVAAMPPPWTDDPVLAAWRFTNAFRAADRVSQFLIREVIYAGDQAPSEVVFRILLFRWFNRIGTWKVLTERLGTPTLAAFDASEAEQILTSARAAGTKIYSAAYIIPPVAVQPRPKHAGHVLLTLQLLESGLADRAAASTSLEDLYRTLLACPGMGPFLAFQLAIDINYSSLVDHDEDEFVVAGPGALDGLSKVWPSSSPKDATRLIRWTADEQDDRLSIAGRPFGGLFGRRLKLIDCQNLYCEIGKYARLVHPDVPGRSGRTQIKQTFAATSDRQPLPVPFFPPKWGLEVGPSRQESPSSVEQIAGVDQTFVSSIGSSGSS